MNKLLTIIVVFVALGAGALVYQTSINLALPEHSLYYQEPRVIKPFQFVDQHDEIFDNKNLANKWSVVFFGYTSCPDVCPTTLQELNFAYDALKVASKDVQILLVSVDPVRDTTKKLAQYISYFNDEFIALSAGHSVLFPFARNMGLMYSITDGSKGEGYLVDHSASIVLINPEGKIAAIFKPEHKLGELPIISGDHLASDLTKIVNLYSN
jgi:protein SCO1/2